MNEVVIESFLMGTLSFWCGVGAGIIEFVVSVGLIYMLFYVICRFLICKNDANKWQSFSNDCRCMCKDFVSMLQDCAAVGKEEVNRWAKEKLDKLRGR